jgi:hypothetical protein
MFQPSVPQYPVTPQAPVVDTSGGYQMMATPPPVTNTKLPKIAIGVLAFAVLLLLGFGVWAFGERQDYKNNSDQKSTAAADAARAAESDRKDTEFVEREKQPYKTYTTPGESGSIKVTYPKTWSAYVEENDDTNPINAYWHPNVVPGLRSDTAYALRMQVTNKAYSEEVRGFDSAVKRGTVKVSPYTPKNVSGIAGSRIEGEVTKGKQSVLIVMPLRDKTIKIWTESPEFVKDFEGIILENLTFAP